MYFVSLCLRAFVRVPSARLAAVAANYFSNTTLSTITMPCLFSSH